MRGRAYMKIKHLIAVLITVLIVLPCVFTIFFSSYHYNRSASELIRENIVTVTEIRAESLRTFFSQRKANLEIIARMPQLSSLLSGNGSLSGEFTDKQREAVRNTLSARSASQPYLRAIHCVDRYDSIVVSSEAGAEGTMFTYLPDIHEVAKGDSMISVVYAGEDSYAFQMIAIPLYYSDSFSGYLVGIISQDYFRNITDNTRYLNSGALTIFDNSGGCLASGYSDSIQSMSDIKANGTLFEKWNAIDFSAAPSGTIDYSINSSERLGYYIHMKDIGLNLLYSIDVNEISSKVFSTTAMVTAAIVLAAATALLLGLVASKIFFSPVKQMLGAINQLGDGDYTVRFDSSGNGEFATIADAFNQLVGKLEKQTDALKQANTDLRMTTENIPGGFYRCRDDSDFEFTFVSDSYLKLLDCTKEELVTLYDNKFMNTVYEPDRMRVSLESKQQMSRCGISELEYRIQLKNGEIRWILEKSQRVEDKTGDANIYCVLVDITSQKRAQEKLKQNDERFRIILEQSDNIIFEWDFKSDALSYSPQWAEKFGYHPKTENVLSMAIASDVYPEDESNFVQWMHSIYKGKGASSNEVRFRTSQGNYIWLKIRSSIISDDSGNSVKAIFLITDIDNEKRQIERLTAQAQADPLTGLYNKGAGQVIIDEYLTGKNAPPSALMIIDMDNFKYVNDTYGHLFGDGILKEIARSLKECCPEPNIVSRIGGDEFIILIKDVSSEEMLAETAENILKKFRGILAVKDDSFNVSGSVGIALYPENGSNFNSLYKHADNALYHAKNQGKDRYSVYNTSMENFGYVKFFEQNHLNHKNESGFKSGLIELVFNMLYETSDISKTILQIFEIIGRHYNVSRVYLFENSSDNLSCSNTYEWCNDDVSHTMDYLQDISYRSVSNHDRDFDSQGIYYCSNIDDCDTDLYNILAPQGIRSMLHCAVYDKGVFRGFVGFDDCSSTRYWTKDEIDILSFVSRIISVFILKNQAQRSISECLRISNAIENSRLWSYVVDKDTKKLKYVCRSLKKMYPAAEVGEICYKAFDKDAPCGGCPLFTEADGARVCKVYDSEILGFKVCSEFIEINLNEKEDAYLITNTAINADVT